MSLAYFHLNPIGSMIADQHYPNDWITLILLVVS